jgi:site-specific recombinase XerD
MNRLHRFDVLVAWYREYMTVNGYRPRTIRDYSFELSFFRRFLHEKTELPDIDELTPQIIRDYAAYLFDRNVTATTIHHKLSAVNSFFCASYEQKKIYADYRDYINLPRVNKKLPANMLSEEETKRIFDHLEVATDNLQINTAEDAVLLRDRAIFEVLYSTAIRRNELTGLLLADVDYDGGLLFIRSGKGGKDRVVPIGKTALEVVRRYVAQARPILAAKGNESLFVNRKFGTRLGDYTIRECVMNVAKAAGLEKHVRVHSMRHTCATHLLNNGADIRYVQELLGHASLSSTQIYTHVSINKLKETHRKFHPREKALSGEL